MSLVIVDGNALGYAQHSATVLSVGKFQTQAVFGFTKAIRDIKVENPNAELIVLWDGKAQFRYDLYPEYKANRKVDEKVDPKAAAIKQAYKAQVPFIQFILSKLNVEQRLNYDLEADDLAAAYVPQHLDSGKGGITLVTGDRDWLQLVRSGVLWSDPRDKSRIVTLENFFDATGYKTTSQFLQGKALQGDQADNISGVGGIGEKGAMEFIAEWGSVAAYFKAVDEEGYVAKQKKYRDLALPKKRAIFKRNLALMNLVIPRKIDESKQHQFSKALDLESTRAVFDRLGFISILRDFDNFVRPFK